MKGENINIIDNLIQAISILNKTDEYLESLNDELSKCDSLRSDYEHFIENMEIDKVDLVKLFLSMQEVLKQRRIIKNDMALKENYKSSINRLNNIKNREFLIQDIKNTQSRLGVKYHNRILKEKDVNDLILKENKKKRGRPKKEGVA